MVFPYQQQRQGNNYPNRMNQSPNDFMFPQRNLNRQSVSSPGKNNIQSMLQRFIQPQSTTANLAGKGAGGLSQTLNNVQQVLKAVQTTTPIIQEYGPMVKNLPAMYRMMKAFKEVENTDNKTAESVSTEIRSEESVEPTISKDSKPPKTSGHSTPKLFI